MKLYKGTATVEADLNQIATMKAAGWSLYPEIQKPTVAEAPLPIPAVRKAELSVKTPVPSAHKVKVITPTIRTIPEPAAVKTAKYENHIISNN